jgi:hypothetical protein
VGVGEIGRRTPSAAGTWTDVDIQWARCGWLMGGNGNDNRNSVCDVRWMEEVHRHDVEECNEEV